MKILFFELKIAAPVEKVFLEFRVMFVEGEANAFSLIVNMHIYSNLWSRIHMEERIGRKWGGAWRLGEGHLWASRKQLRYPRPAHSASYELAAGTLCPCAVLFLRKMFRAVTHRSRPTDAAFPQRVVPEVLALT